MSPLKESVGRKSQAVLVAAWSLASCSPMDKYLTVEYFESIDTITVLVLAVFSLALSL